MPTTKQRISIVVEDTDHTRINDMRDKFGFAGSAAFCRYCIQHYLNNYADQPLQPIRQQMTLDMDEVRDGKRS